MSNEVVSSEILQAFESINLEQLAAVDFEGRVDTKFIFPAQKLSDFLRSLVPEAFILEVNSERIFHYRNLYFDTAEYELFGWHRAGRKNRLKVRARAYHDNGPFVFEIKRKNNKGFTRKERISLPDFEHAKSELTSEFLISKLGFGFDKLCVEVPVNYSRMTFANKELTEKFTLDIQLHTFKNNHPMHFEALAIAELKQEKFRNSSVFMQNLKQLGIFPHAFSKYCASVLRIEDHIKKNRFLPLLRKLNKIENGAHH
jgi:hypothetical protein